MVLTPRYFDATTTNCSAVARSIVAAGDIMGVIALVDVSCHHVLQANVAPAGIPILFCGQGRVGELGLTAMDKNVFITLAPVRDVFASMRLFLKHLDWTRPVLVTDASLSADDLRAFAEMSLARNVLFQRHYHGGGETCSAAALRAADETIDARSPLIVVDM